MSERPEFGRGDVAPVAGRLLVMAVGLCLVGGLLIVRESFFWQNWRSKELAHVVQVDGDVPRPGWYSIDPPTLHQAVRAAGGDPTAYVDQPLETAQRVWIDGAEVDVGPSGNERVFGLPIELNEAEPVALKLLPGIGDVRAQAIVDWRRDHGPFDSVDRLDDVPGIGAATVERIRPFVHVRP